MLDFNSCIIEQINVDEYTPQEVADVIFKARDHRMENFPTDNEIYKPLEGTSYQEQDYCLSHEFEIEQSVYDMTMQEYYQELIDSTYKALEEAKFRLKMK